MSLEVESPASSSQPMRLGRDLSVLAVGYVLLLVVAFISPGNGFAPLAAVLLLLFVGRAAAAPRFGLIATLVLTLLIPLTLAIPIGPVSLGIGRAVGFAFVAGWLASLSRPRAPLYRRTPLDWAFFALLFAIFLSVLSNSAQLTSSQFTQGFRTFATVLVDYTLFFLAAVSIMGAGRRHFDAVLRAAAFIIVVIAFIGIAEYLTGRNVFSYFNVFLPPGFRNALTRATASATRQRGGLRRVLATFEGPNRFSGAMAMGLPLLLHFWATTKTARRWFYAAGAIAAGIGALIAVSRSALACMVIVLILYFVGAGGLRAAVAPVAGVVGALALILAISPHQRDVLAFYYRDLVGPQKTIQGRTEDYRFVAGQVILHPIAGSGPGTYGPIAIAEASKRGDIKNPAAFGVLDNAYLGFLTEEGMLGLLAFAGVTFGGVWLAARSWHRARTRYERSLRSALLGSTLVYALLGFFFDIFSFQSVTKLYLVLLAATVVASGRMRPYGRPRWRSTPKGVAA